VIDLTRNKIVEEYIDAGLKLVALQAGTKKPKSSGWSEGNDVIENKSEALLAVARDDNIAVHHVLSNTCALDVDNYDLARDFLLHHFSLDLNFYKNDIPYITTGTPNHIKFLFVNTTRAPLRSVLNVIPGAELRCATRRKKSLLDALPPSIHPETGEVYRWNNKDASDVFEIPPIPQALLEIWRTYEPPESQPDALAKTREFTYSDVDVELCRQVLETLDSDCSYNEWNNIGMALTSLGEEGFKLWRDWSSKGEKYPGEAALRAKYEGHLEDVTELTHLSLLHRLEKTSKADEVAENIMRSHVEKKAPKLFIDSVGTAVFYEDQAPPPELVKHLFPLAPWVIVGSGGMSKTTMILRMFIEIILERRVFGVFEPQRSGPCVLITEEDEESQLKFRLKAVADNMDLTDTDKQILGENIVLLNPSRFNLPVRLVERQQYENLTFSDFTKALCTADFKPACVVFDPVSHFADEILGNDGYTMLMRAGAAISKSLDCSVGFIHHVSKEVARNNIIDMHSGRGGSALGDNARAVGVMSIMNKKRLEEEPVPTTVSDEDVAEGRVVQFQMVKYNYGPLFRDPIYIVRCKKNPFSFSTHLGINKETEEGEDMMLERQDAKDQRVAADRRNAYEVIWDYVQEKSKAGVECYKTILREDSLLKSKLPRSQKSKHKIEAIVTEMINREYFSLADGQPAQGGGPTRKVLLCKTSPHES
jgi:RecA-family ATPase